MAELSIQAQIAEAHRSEAERAAFAVKERARLELEELEKATAPSKAAAKADPKPAEPAKTETVKAAVDAEAAKHK